VVLLLKKYVYFLTVVQFTIQSQALKGIPHNCNANRKRHTNIHATLRRQLVCSYQKGGNLITKINMKKEYGNNTNPIFAEGMGLRLGLCYFALQIFQV